MRPADSFSILAHHGSSTFAWLIAVGGQKCATLRMIGSSAIAAVLPSSATAAVIRVFFHVSSTFLCVGFLLG